MKNTSYIALSRQTVVRRQMDILANNIANAATPAFKSEHMLFVEHLARSGSAQSLSFVQDVAVVRDTAEGAFTQTGNTLDLAISGDGYFVVETPEGVRYTRAGALRLDEDGALITSQGFALLDQNGRPLTVPSGDSTIEIAPDGTLATETGQVGQLKVVRFANEQALRRTFGGIYETNDEPLEAPDARVMQGMIEESNVQPIIEMTNLISAMRGYQSTQRLIEAEHQRQRQVIESLTERA